MSMIKNSVLCLTVGASALMSGCLGYVNIPPQKGDIAVHNPNMVTVRHVLAEALNQMVQAYPFEGRFAVLLPEDTTSDTYEQVVPKVSKKAVWPGNPERDEIPVLEVKRIRIRGQDAQVDIVRPLHGDQKDVSQVVTATLKWHPLQGWVTQRLRAWELSTDDAMRFTLEDLP